MKRCPKCRREFDDDLRFCLEDGTPLTASEIARTAAAPTMVLPVDNHQANTISQVARPDVPLPGFQKPREASPHFDREREPAGSALPARIVGAVLLVLLVISNAVGMIVWGGIVGRRIPLTLGFMAVMLFAMIRARRHPKVSLLVTAALGFDLLETFVYMIVIRALPANFYQALAIVDSFLAAAVIVMLTLAVLSERTSQTAIN